jgi:hypothetical protein
VTNLKIKIIISGLVLLFSATSFGVEANYIWGYSGKQVIPSGQWTKVKWSFLPINKSSLQLSSDGIRFVLPDTAPAGYWSVYSLIAWSNAGNPETHRRMIRIVQSGLSTTVEYPSVTNETVYVKGLKNPQIPQKLQVYYQAGIQPTGTIFVEVFQDSGQPMEIVSEGLEAPIFGASRVSDL